MDPVSALGIASGVITFVDFAAKLISTTKDVFSSGEGTTLENLQLEDIYSSLHRLSAQLEQREQATPTPQRSLSISVLSGSSSPDLSALRDLAGSCRKDFEDLLSTLQAVRVQHGRHRLWKNVKTVFKSTLSIRKIADIEGRLERTQRVLSLHVGSILSHEMSRLTKTLRSLESETRVRDVDQTAKIRALTDVLQDLTLERHDDNTCNTQQAIVSPAQLQILIERLSEHASVEGQLRREKSIIGSLNYTCRPIRHEAIPVAHRNTFSWAFESILAEWFEEGSGIFWISGKAGSGKSTLVKYLAGHSRTRQLLDAWAGPKRVTVAAHYFWGSGTMMQKSVQGLLQSLLHDIFRQIPSVIPMVVPHRWEPARRSTSPPAGLLMESWTMTELKAALLCLSTAADLPTKLCFFVDGLDEYWGDHLELCDILREISQSPHIKLCISSRPWNVFEDSFGQDPLKKLLVHELTRTDIKNFTADQLQAHPRWTANSIGMSDSDRKELVDEVANRAEGVFLWVFLVTRSLRDGLSNDDTVTDMWNRLRSLPRDLEQLFRYMLESVDPVYHPKASGILQMALHAKSPPSTDLCWHFEKGLEDSDYAFECPIHVQSASQISRQREQTSRRLNARTKGLLEVRYNRVEFLHRTVRDFLLTREMGEYLESKVSFDCNIFYYISKAHLDFIKTQSFENPVVPGIVRQGLGQNGGTFIPYLHETLFSITEAAKANDSPSNHSRICALLDEFERATVMLLESSQVTVGGIEDLKDKRVPFREEVLKHELAFYLEKKLQAAPGFFSKFPASPLFAALAPIRLASMPDLSLPCRRTVEILLECGESPNSGSKTRHGGHLYTPWFQFMALIIPDGVYGVYDERGPTDPRWERFRRVVEGGLFDLLLSHGANPNEVLHGGGRGDRTVFANYLSLGFSGYFRSEVQEKFLHGYIHTLGVFLRSGAKLDVPMFETGGSPTPTDPQEGTLMAALCTKLMDHKGGLEVPTRARCLYLVCETLICHLSGTSSEFNALVSVIVNFCPQHMAEDLLKLAWNKSDRSKRRWG